MGTVVRIGNTVRRSAGPWTPSVHALLAYLASRGFEGAPTPLGVDDHGREVLTFIDGETVTSPIPDVVWYNTLVPAARLLRRFHDMSADFIPASNARWRAHPDDAGPAEVICHSDWAPYNAVFRGGRLIAMIDWDFARPGSRLYDLAWCALMWCPLADPATFRPDLPVRVEQPARLRELVDAYGLNDRAGLVDAIFNRVAGAAEWLEAGAREGDPARTKMVADGHAAHYRRLLLYLDSIRSHLEAVLG